MSSSTDVVISEVPARMYTVPAALSASVGDRVTLDVVYDVLHEGSEEARIWAARIVNGVERERLKQEKAILASIGHDPEKYFYWGITDLNDDDLINAVGRIEKPYTNIEKTEILSENASWRPVSDDISSNTRQTGVALDTSLLAFTASAFAEGCVGVRLAFGEPLCFLEHQPILAAVTPSEQDKKSIVYAIVDATDTTAVMDVIQIRTGPEVYRRDGGTWVLDTATLDSLLSVSPPPIVELSGSTLTDVLSQVDGSKANQVVPTDDGQGDTGDLLNDEETDPIKTDPKKALDPTASSSKQALPSAKPSDTPSKDTYSTNQNKSQIKDGSTTRTAALLQRYDEIEALLASIRNLSPDIEADASQMKIAILADASRMRKELTLRESQINNIVIPALVADAVSVHDATPNQRKAKHLRKYWIRGQGAVKIAWGTPGDFTRCVRQLRKYLGPRAEGYCSKRHKEAMGFWPGDKRNTGPTKGVGTPKTD